MLLKSSFLPKYKINTQAFLVPLPVFPHERLWAGPSQGQASKSTTAETLDLGNMSRRNYSNIPFSPESDNKDLAERGNGREWKLADDSGSNLFAFDSCLLNTAEQDREHQAPARPSTALLELSHAHIPHSP